MHYATLFSVLFQPENNTALGLKYCHTDILTLSSPATIPAGSVSALPSCVVTGKESC